MRLLTICGTRPELIRLSGVIKAIEATFGEHNHILLYTNQNYTPDLKDVFFDELGLGEPAVTLAMERATFGQQVGIVLDGVEQEIRARRPDGVLILGDTTSGLAAIACKRMGVPVFHMEAGNRCHDDKVPEEVNRKLIDSCSTILLPYTERSRANLIEEGYPNNRIFVTGNPINEVLHEYRPAPQGTQDHILLTLHRTENTDDPERLASILKGVEAVAERFGHTVIFPAHPRTRDKLPPLSDRIHVRDAMGLLEFLRYEASAHLVLTDSGTVPEECCLLNVPCIILRDSTERPELLECGSTLLGGVQEEGIVTAAHHVLTNDLDWVAPPEYTRENVAHTVVNIIASHLHAWSTR